ncbi:MAG: MFS transporter [Bacteroidetes bacterium]|nr:MFS transporter [Bacteroidota bacterium]
MQNWKRVFGIIWTGQLFSTLSSSVVGYAVVFWLSIETRSAQVLALSTIAVLLPQMLIGPFTGVFVDRWNRRRTMIIADSFIAVCTLIMAMLFIKGNVKISFVYLLLVMRSVGSAFHVPAMQASIPLLAPESELMRISGINQIIQSVSVIAGPALAALLISILNMTWVLMFDVIGALIGIISLLLVYIPDPPRKDIAVTPSVIRELKEGFYEIYKHSGLLWLFVIILAAHFFIMPVSALFPLMTINHFNGGTYQMSIVEVAWGLGMLAGGALLGIKKIKVSEIMMINATFLILGLTFFFSGILPESGFWFFTALTLIGGITMALFSSAFTVVIQTHVDKAILGRVFSLYGSLTLLPSMLGLLQTGYVADVIGIPNAFIIAGIAIAALGTTAFFIPALKAMAVKTVTELPGKL